MESIENFLLSRPIDLLDKILAASIDHIYLFDRAGRFLYASPTGLVALGLNTNEVLGKTWRELDFPADLMQRHDAERESVFQTGVPVASEMKFPTMNGIRDYEYVLSPIQGAAGEIDVIVSTVRDVTERNQTEDALRQLAEDLEARVLARTQELVDLNTSLQAEIAERQKTEQALHASEAQLSQILNNAGASIVSFRLFADRTWQYDYYSAGCEAVFGYRPAEMMTDIWLSRVLPEDQASVILYSQEAIVAERPTRIEYRFRHKDDSLRWISSDLSSHWDSHHNCWQVIAIDSDITDRKQSELALQESETRFAAAFQSSPDAMLITRISDGLILDANAQFAQLLGYSLEETIGQTTLGLQLWIDPVDRDTIIAHLQTSPTLQNYEVSCRCKSGEIMIGLFSCQIIELGGQACMLSVMRDISDRKRIEQVLQTSEARYRVLTEISPVAIFRFDAPLNCVYVNDRWSEMTGRPKESALGQGWLAALHPDERDEVVAQWLERYAQANLGNFILNSTEGRHLCPDGSINWYYAQLAAEIDRTGKVIGYVGTLTDITDRKIAEAKLRESESLLRLFVQYAPTGIVMLDREMRYVMMSQRWIDDYYLGSIESLIGRSHYEVMTGIPDAYKAVHQRCLAGAIEQGEGCFIGVDGTEQWTSWEVRPWYQATGEIGGIIIFSEYINERKQAEAAILQLNRTLQQRVTELQTLLDVIPIGIGIAEGRDCHSIRANPAFAQLLGIPPTDNASLSAPEAERPRNFKVYQNGRELALEELSLQHAAAHGVEVRDFEVDVVWQDGTVVKLLEYAAPLFDEKGQTRGSVGAFLDITDRKKTELALQELNQSLEAIVAERTAELRASEAQIRQQADREILRNQQLAISNQELARATRLKDEFLANMSHELRTPLNAILGMAEGLQEQVFGAVNAQQLTALQTIERTGLHLLALINDILDLAKVESGQLELNCAPTDMRLLCRSSLDFIKQQALKKQIQLDLKLPANLPELWIDERRMRQVLVNLLNNAVKFTGNRGRITLEVDWPVLQQSDEAAGSWLRLAVVDTGIGIAPEDIDKLFQPFVQIDSALNRQYEGTGLGLALVKRIVELHGGQVGLTSELGVGSCFTIDLPDVVAHFAATEPQPPMLADQALNQIDQGPAPLILLVEDNEDNIVTIATYLEAKGNRVQVAREGQEAIDRVEAERPDLILMDIQMPGMDGLEAMRRIRCLPDLGDMPIIALTALAMEGDREKCLAAGANDYLSKPVKLKQLTAKIQQLLEAR